jgi:hypothetical protein
MSSIIKKKFNNIPMTAVNGKIAYEKVIENI